MRIHICPSMERFDGVEYYAPGPQNGNVMAMYEVMEAEVEEEGERIRWLLINILANPQLKPTVYRDLARAGVTHADLVKALVFFKPSEQIPAHLCGTIVTDDRDRTITSFASPLRQYIGRTDLHKPNRHTVQR